MKSDESRDFKIVPMHIPSYRKVTNVVWVSQEKQIFVKHTILQTDISALPDKWNKNTSFLPT
jgi:hypothetical protein